MRDFNEKLDKLKWSAKNAFSDISDNQKKGTIFKLLNALQSGDKNQVNQLICRLIASNSESDNFKKLSCDLNSFSENESFFEKIAYTLILGMMCKNNNKTGGNADE